MGNPSKEQEAVNVATSISEMDGSNGLETEGSTDLTETISGSGGIVDSDSQGQGGGANGADGDDGNAVKPEIRYVADALVASPQYDPSGVQPLPTPALTAVAELPESDEAVKDKIKQENTEAVRITQTTQQLSLDEAAKEKARPDSITDPEEPQPEAPRPPSQMNGNGVVSDTTFQEIMGGIEAMPAPPPPALTRRRGVAREEAAPGAFCAGEPGLAPVAIQAPRYSIFGRLSDNSNAADTTLPSFPSITFGSKAMEEDHDVENGETHEAPTRRDTHRLAIAEPVSSRSSEMFIPHAKEVTDSEHLSERKRQLSSENNLNSQQKWKRTIVLCACVMVVICIPLSILLATTMRSDHYETQTTPPPVSDVPTLPPTTESSIWYLIPNETKREISRQGTPQSQAYDWLLADPYLPDYPRWRILQRLALATLYYSTTGERWFNNSDWLSYEIHECFWYSAYLPRQYEQFQQFVEEQLNGPKVAGYWATERLQNHLLDTPCDNQLFFDSRNHSRKSDWEYRHLRLFKNNLHGTIPPEIYFLTALRSVFLFNNDLGGSTISTQVGKLRDLEVLEMVNSGLKGTIPAAVGLLTNLRAVWLFTNKLSGTISSGIGLLSNLDEILVEENALTGIVPSEIGMLSNLTHLHLGDNELNGTLPTEFGLFSALADLQIKSTNMTGTLPSEIGRMTSLQHLLLASMHLDGSLPFQLGLLGKLKEMHIFGTDITGTVPTEIGMMSSLGHIDFSNSNVMGTLPEELLQLATRGNLSKLTLEGTLLSGEISPEICTAVEMSFDCSESLCGCDCSCGFLNATNQTL